MRFNKLCKSTRIISLSVTAALSLYACTGTPRDHSDENSEPQAQNATIKKQYKAFNSDSIYDLLLAEFALRRGVSDQAAQLYYDQALQQNDRQLAAHAARLAHSLENYNLAIKAADLWLRLSPDNAEALSIKTIALVNSDQDLSSAYPLLQANASFKHTAIFTHLALNAKTQRQRWTLRNYFAQLVAQHPQSNNLLMAYAYLLRTTDNDPRAQTLMSKALSHNNSIEALLLNVEISDEQHKAAALAKLKTFLSGHQNNSQIQEQALTVISQTDPEYALQITNKLIAQEPRANLLLQLAKINIKLERLRNADVILQNLLLSPGYKTQAHYLLGVIKRKQNKNREALSHFFLAQEDDYLIPATESLISTLMALGQQQAAFNEFKKARSKARKSNDRLHLFLLEASLYNQTGQSDRALQTLNTALILFPNNTRILYNRALTNMPIDTTAAISDLQKVLQLEPHNAPALNALAYHYVEQNKNLTQAQALIDQALAIDPREAQYLDTKGWLAFQRGHWNDAENYLKQAYSARPEPSIVAHLIETLWTQGKHQQGFNLWKKASVKFPDNRHINETMARLNIDTRRFDKKLYVTDHTMQNNLKQLLAQQHAPQEQYALSDRDAHSVNNQQTNIEAGYSTAKSITQQHSINTERIEHSNLSTQLTQRQNQDIAALQLAQNDSYHHSRQRVNQHNLRTPRFSQRAMTSHLQDNNRLLPHAQTKQQINAYKHSLNQVLTGAAQNQHHITAQPYATKTSLHHTPSTNALADTTLDNKELKQMTSAPAIATRQLVVGDRQQTTTKPNTRRPRNTKPESVSQSYAIQLAAMLSDKQFERFLAQLPPTTNALTYKRTKDGFLWNIAILGPYPNKLAAKTAMQYLDSELKSQRPWLKSMREISREQRTQLTRFKPKTQRQSKPQYSDTATPQLATSTKTIASPAHYVLSCPAQNINNNNLLLSSIANKLSQLSFTHSKL